MRGTWLGLLLCDAVEEGALEGAELRLGEGGDEGLGFLVVSLQPVGEGFGPGIGYVVGESVVFLQGFFRLVLIAKDSVCRVEQQLQSCFCFGIGDAGFSKASHKDCSRGDE